MLRAVNKQHTQSFISYDDTITLSKEIKYYCPHCKHEVLFINSKLKIKHFRHKVKINCNPEPETQEHIIMKWFMMENLNLNHDNLEVGLGFARPDIYFEKDGKKIAIEVQHSKLSYDKFIERTKNYTLNNIYVLWVFHEKLLNENYISEVIKKSHELYYGRIYIFYNNFNEEIIPVHLERVWSYVEPFQGYKDYYKLLKKARKIRMGEPLIDFNILTTINDYNNNNVMIARFYDKKFWKTEKELLEEWNHEQIH